ncbi:MAG TPA: hypothetical protein VN043_08075, partial [Rhodanobacter sp.]|nr:hypothetical protein [Rhodanobacter sp.]
RSGVTSRPTGQVPASIAVHCMCFARRGACFGASGTNDASTMTIAPDRDAAIVEFRAGGLGRRNPSVRGMPEIAEFVMDLSGIS